MAKARRRDRVLELREVEVQPAGYVLELTEEEASALVVILGKISGGGTLRRRTRPVFDELRTAGANWPIVGEVGNIMATEELDKDWWLQ